MNASHNGKKRIRTGRRMSARKRRRARLLFCFALLCAVGIGVISYVSLYQYVYKQPLDKIYKNVYIGNTDVSGMTRKEAKAALLESEAQDESVNITMKIKDEAFEVSLKELGIRSKDVQKSAEEAYQYGKSGSLWTRFRHIRRLEKEKTVLPKKHSIQVKKTKKVIKERAEKFVKHAVDASISKEGEKFNITKEKQGKVINADQAVKDITTHINDRWNHGKFSVKLTMKTEKPSVTEEDLKSIKDELSSFSTDAGGGQRWQNLKNGVEKINGSILMPGQEFSVYEATGPYDAEHGYVEAGSYENGQVVDSFGGGICQVSTTLYNTILYAELEVLERYPHSMLVAYVDPSKDAAIATGFMDFRFKNNYDTPVLITGQIDELNQLQFAVYGKESRPQGRTVEYESETLSTDDYGVTYKEDAQASLGSMAYAGNPHTGKTAQLWKVVYQDGVEQSRDVINHSNYEKADQIIMIGTKSDNETASYIVRQAIASQKDSTIQAAIVQAKGLPQ